jgi:hypothetical protein
VSRDICPWTGEPWTESEQRAHAARDAGYDGWLDQDGYPVMSRTDPATGQAQGFETPGWSGRGTPDDPDYLGGAA